MTDDAVAKVPCRECGMQVLPDARVCGYCESYQARWRNELRYFANIAGIFTVIGTAIFFSISLAPTLDQALFWTDEIAVLRVDGGNMTLANAGDGKVFIYEVIFRVPGDDPLVHAVNDTLSPGTILQIEGGGFSLLEFDGGLERGDAPWNRRLLSADDPLWSQATQEAVWEFYDSGYPHPETGERVQEIDCFQVVSVSEGGNYWTRATRHLGRSPGAVAVEGMVRGYSLHRGAPFETPFQARGLVFEITGLTEAGATHDEGEIHPLTGDPIPEGLPLCEVF
jgi:hypothetical protein